MRRSVARLRYRRRLPLVEFPAASGVGAEIPLVSIIVATFNRSNVLAITLESVRAQTVTDWEVLVVGDHCTDDTQEVVQSLHDPRIRFVNLPANLGDQSGPNSIGARMARGRYLAWLNHDDLWFPDHLETLLHELQAQDADLAVAGCFRIFGLDEHDGSVSGLVHAPVPARPLQMARGDVFLASCWLMSRQLAGRLGDWRPAGSVRYASSQQYFYRAWSSGARIVLGQQRSVVIVPSIAHEGAYATRRDAEHRIAARLVRAGDRAAFARLIAPGSELLTSPVLELPVSKRRRGPLGRWMIRHRERIFASSAPMAVRLGVAPWEYAAMLVGFPRGGLNARLRAERGLAPARSSRAPTSRVQSSQVNEN